MPVFELECRACGRTEDCYFPRWDAPDPACPLCGGARERLMSRFAAPLMGSLKKYADPKREDAHAEGFWAYKTRSSASGRPEPVFLSTMEEVRAFNKAEGLADPSEVPTHSTISADGRRIVSNGMPGQWVSSMPEMPSRLREMVNVPAEQCRAPAATAAPSMPADFGVRPEVTVAPVEVG